MIAFLAKRFIREGSDEKVRRKAYGVLCGAVGIGLNVLLFLGKFFAGTLAGSIAITADAFNNLSDAGSSFVTLLGFQLAGQKPDSDHPFGHGRIEYLSGLVVSMLILLMGFELAKSSLQKILHPEMVTFSPLVLGILVVSIAVKFYMFLYNRSIGRKINSPGMMATSIDSISDVVTTLSVLVGMVIGQMTGLQVDGWCGVLVAGFILYSGIKSTVETLSPLLGNPPEQEFVDQIESIVLAYDEITR